MSFVIALTIILVILVTWLVLPKSNEPETVDELKRDIDEMLDEFEDVPLGPQKPTREELQKMTKIQIHEKAQEFGIVIKGYRKKAELIDYLLKELDK